MTCSSAGAAARHERGPLLESPFFSLLHTCSRKLLSEEPLILRARRGLGEFMMVSSFRNKSEERVAPSKTRDNTECATRRIPMRRCVVHPFAVEGHLNPRMARSPKAIATNQTPSNPMRGRSLAVFGNLAEAGSGCGAGAAAATCLGAGASSTSSTPT